MVGGLRARHVHAAVMVALVTACGSSVGSSDPDPLDPAEGGAPESGIDAPTPPSPPDGGVDARDASDAGDASDARDASDSAVDAAPDGGFPATVTQGAADRILLIGTVVTPDVSFVGQVLVEGKLITCAEAGNACSARIGAIGATIIDTHGVIAPGLIDTHNHILFDIFDDSDWLPSQVYADHDEWPNELRYQAMLDVKQCLEDASQGKPVWCPATYDGPGSLKCEMDKWGELKGMIAGTTSIVGLAGTTSQCFSSLARTIDASQNGLGQDKIQTSALFPPSRSAADGVCNNFAAGTTDAYLIHVGEGTNASALAEFAKLGTVTTSPGCLYAPQTTITHGTAFTANEFAQMGISGMKLTWSPASNVALYGKTTDVPAALDANVVVALAPDWSMGGSQNLLDEMRFADSWDDLHFADRLKAKDLVTMTTKNAASVLALSGRIGTITVGALADLMVVSASQSNPWSSIVGARPKDVRMTMIGGRVLYGDLALKTAAPALPGCETIDICGTAKFVCVAETTTTTKLDQTLVQIKAALEAALVDVDAVTPNDGYDFAPLAPLVKCN